MEYFRPKYHIFGILTLKGIVSTLPTKFRYLPKIGCFPPEHPILARNGVFSSLPYHFRKSRPKWSIIDLKLPFSGLHPD